MIEAFYKASFLTKSLCCAAFLLLFLALFINLGLIAFIDDEGIRSLVALEMLLSGNYITPTLFGEYYYNKPPLYNWILLLFFKLTGTVNEWTARTPTVFFLLLYASTIFYFFKKHFSLKIAFFNAFALITCGRILFWDSMLGLIDICFSWVIFLLFMVVYHAFEKRQFYHLFGWAYFLTALAFLMKGLPAIMFLGTVLLTQFIYQRQFKKLFSLAHLFGGSVFLSLVGGYYWAYNQYHSLEIVFSTLFNESSKRTLVKYSWEDTLIHLFTFPFEMTYHFLPWTLLGIYFFQKNILTLIKKSPFVTYNLLLFVTTIIVYWTSVEVYPRYLFMHVPLLFSVFFYLHEQHRRANTVLFRLIERLFFTLCVATIVAVFAIPFLPEISEIQGLFWKISTLAGALTILTYLYFYQKKERLLIFIIVLLVARIGFNWFVLPSRLKIEWSTQVRESSIEIGQKYKELPFYNYKQSMGFQPANGFYLTNERQQIVRTVHEDFDKNAIYLIHPNPYFKVTYEKLDELKMMYKKQTLNVGKLK